MLDILSNYHLSSDLIRTTTNKAAHVTAKFALNCNTSMVWMSTEYCKTSPASRWRKHDSIIYSSLWCRLKIHLLCMDIQKQKGKERSNNCNERN